MALVMIMRQGLANPIMERSFPEYKQLLQRFLLHGAHTPLAVWVQGGTPRWQDDGPHTTGLEQPIACLRACAVPVVHQVSLAQEEPRAGIRELSGTLRHEGPTELTVG